MEPLTLIATAVALGAALGLKSTTEQAVKDAYAALKNFIMDKYKEREDLTEAVTKLEKNPESEGRKVTLKEELEAAHATQDAELIKLAQALVAKAAPQVTQGSTYTVTGDGNVIGSGNTVSIKK